MRDGILDFVATDHAPHASEEKELPFEEAAPGFLGHETAFAALYTELVLGGGLAPTAGRGDELLSGALGRRGWWDLDRGSRGPRARRPLGEVDGGP